MRVLKLAGGLLAVGLALPVVWSMATETLWPLWRAAAYGEFALNVLGLPLIVLGTGAFVWGGGLFYVDTLRLTNDDAFIERSQQARDRERPAHERRSAEQRQLRTMFQTWARGLRWLALGAGLIGAGSLFINWLPEVLGLN